MPDAGCRLLVLGLQYSALMPIRYSGLPLPFNPLSSLFPIIEFPDIMRGLKEGAVLKVTVGLILNSIFSSRQRQLLAPVAQMDRVLGYEPRGRAFESLRAHHQFNGLGQK